LQCAENFDNKLVVIGDKCFIDVIDAISGLADKCCASDPVPTYLLKAASSCVAAFLTELFNRSLQSGRVPALFISAYVTPLVKKLDLDASDVRSYRPISNLTVVSKLLVQLVARQHDLLPILQSAYRSGHSTETAVFRVLSDTLLAIDSGDVAVLAMLDLSAAFDKVDYQILLQRLRILFGISDLALSRFQSHLKDRVQHVRLGTHRSSVGRVLSGIPQGSVLGPILFLLYTADFQAVIEHHNLRPHFYADDVQINSSAKPSVVPQLQSQLLDCIDDVAGCMHSNRLQLNMAKTEITWGSTSRRQHQLPTTAVRVGSDFVAQSTSVRNLGVFLNSEISMKTHVRKTVCSCFGMLRQLRSVRRSVPVDTF
jgi:hypothetical protein